VSMTDRRIEYLDDGPDALGRRKFVIHWTDSSGVWRSEPWKDGQPVGFRRAQYFFGRPADYGLVA
jgi:hypothetical protein